MLLAGLNTWTIDNKTKTRITRVSRPLRAKCRDEAILTMYTPPTIPSNTSGPAASRSGFSTVAVAPSISLDRKGMKYDPAMAKIMPARMSASDAITVKVKITKAKTVVGCVVATVRPSTNAETTITAHFTYPRKHLDADPAATGFIRSSTFPCPVYGSFYTVCLLDIDNRSGRCHYPICQGGFRGSRVSPSAVLHLTLESLATEFTFDN